MQETAAKRLVKETLQNSFKKERFVSLVKNILNEFDESKACHFRGYIKEAFKPIIKTYERLGTYTDPGDKKVDILIVQLKENHSIERSRTSLRNFVAGHLRQRNNKDAALVAFVAPNKDEWRFSFVEMKYVFNERGQIEQKLTHARRYSFLVGKNENSHTAQSRFLEILQDDDTNPTLERLEKAFSVERVTKEFFEKYRDLFLRLQKSLNAIVEKNPDVKTNFKSTNVRVSDFSKKLLGQIVFLYFLQKKGWFGVKQHEKWGSGSKHFLRELFENEHGNYINFFNEILEPLFYKALNSKRPGDYYSKFNCRIPFLNGGLFDPINNYDWKNVEIPLPNRLFSNKNTTIEGDTGDGILDIFDRYNFTVKEDEPLEKEVAIDPEMLGKVFENLLQVKDRKSKGTFYTRREIVHYMCQESLIYYLATELDDKVNKKDIEMLIKQGEMSIEHDIVYKEKTSADKNYRGPYKESELPKSVENYAAIIDKKLKEIRICDPAVGSGAFVVGMMNEIIKTRITLTPHLKKDKNRSSYYFKWQAIKNCLYGVDIDLGAVEIAKLRLWLSLIVDEGERGVIKPLPNLDYKIVQGDSLSKVEKNLLNADIFEQIEKLKPLYFNEISTMKKQKYKEKIDELIDEVANEQFDFQVYFSEVFHEKEGFDVIIANPPYISYGLRGGQSISSKEKASLKKSFPNSAEYKVNLYAIFMDRGLQLAKPDGGLQTYIVPDSFLLGRYFSKIRELTLKISEIIYILLLPFNVFEATVGFSVIYLFQKRKSISPNHCLTARFSTDIKDIDAGNFKEISYPQEYFERHEHKKFRLFFDHDVMRLILKIEKGSIKLSRIVKFSSGLISKTSQKDIVSNNKEGDKWLPGIISGKEIKRYAMTATGKFILYDKSKIKSGYSNINYSDEKVFMRQTGDSLVCAFDDEGLLALNNVHVGCAIQEISLKYVMAILNSCLMNFYYRTISLESGRVMAQTDIEAVGSLPIKISTPKKTESIIKLVEKILAATKKRSHFEIPKNTTRTQEYEKVIDRLIYKLYDLTDEEIRIVESLR